MGVQACPVCEQEFSTDTDRIEHHLIEEDGSCSCGTYSYHYWAGHYREEIGPFTLVSSYNWTPDNYQRHYTWAVRIARIMRVLRLWRPYLKVSRWINHLRWQIGDRFEVDSGDEI